MIINFHLITKQVYLLNQKLTIQQNSNSINYHTINKLLSIITLSYQHHQCNLHTKNLNYQEPILHHIKSHRNQVLKMHPFINQVLVESVPILLSNKLTIESKLLNNPQQI